MEGPGKPTKKTSPVAQLRTWLQRLDGRAWSRLGIWLLMTLAMSGIPGSLEAMWRDLESAVLPKDFADLIKLTAPLTLTVSGLTLAWRWGWFREGGAIPMAGLFVTGAWLGGWLGHSGAVTPAHVFAVADHSLFGQTVMQAGNYLIAYAQAYGPLGFITSILMGLYLGRWWDDSLRRLIRTYGPHDEKPEASPSSAKPRDLSRAA
jgi:hypothetical protein